MKGSRTKQQQQKKEKQKKNGILCEKLKERRGERGREGERGGEREGNMIKARKSIFVSIFCSLLFVLRVKATTTRKQSSRE